MVFEQNLSSLPFSSLSSLIIQSLTNLLLDWCPIKSHCILLTKQKDEQILYVFGI